MDIRALHIPPRSVAFTLLLALMVALPSFGIDMNLPALVAIGQSLEVTPARAGLTMSLFMVGFAVTPLVYGPASDSYGRKPILLIASALFVVGSIGCLAAQSLPGLLAWRVVQGAGAGGGMTIAFAVVRDLFDGPAGRTKISYVANAMMIVPILAPTAGSALLTLGSWRLIYAFLVGVGGVLLAIVALGFAESARIDPANRLVPEVVARNYGRVLTHPVCLSYVFVNAMGFGALFAYVSGSPLYLIGTAGLTTSQYGLVFAATSLGIMASTFLNGRLSASGAVPPEQVLTSGLGLAAASASLLLGMTLMGWMPLALVIPLLMLSSFAFGLIAPNAMHGAMQPLPEIAGAAGAVVGFVQMTTGAIASALVTSFYGGRSALSMTTLMALCSLLALTLHLLVTRRVERESWAGAQQSRSAGP